MKTIQAEQLIRSRILETPPSSFEEFCKGTTGLQRRRRRTVLIIRAVLVYLAVEFCEARGYDLAEKILVDFGLAFFGSVALLAFVGLQLEGIRIRRVARNLGVKRLDVARVLRRIEKEK